MNRLPTIRDLTAAIVALGVFATTAALLLIGQPLPKEWWPLVAGLAAWLFAQQKVGP